MACEERREGGEGGEGGEGCVYYCQHLLVVALR